ncbi:unnamed protein product [Mytilus coruscus]|uniref:Uncharacterized protein n=1 Tax=Mytilus coruscus TaxID=42192 RepID=A0A6J8DXB6_MYTCO|nr:unnamed protein product [Mytilus coruscus]
MAGVRDLIRMIQLNRKRDRINHIINELSHVAYSGCREKLANEGLKTSIIYRIAKTADLRAKVILETDLMSLINKKNDYDIDSSKKNLKPSRIKFLVEYTHNQAILTGWPYAYLHTNEFRLLTDTYTSILRIFNDYKALHRNKRSVLPIIGKAMHFLFGTLTDSDVSTIKGHLSPSTITPTDLKRLLNEIKNKLPRYFELSEDPNLNLWFFYRLLTCTTVLYNDKILAIISLPLLDSNNRFEVYKAYNLPMPMKNNSTKLLTMVAKFDINVEYFAVNAERSKYVLLNNDEINKCTDRFTKFCKIASPVYPITLSKNCAISLFMKKENDIDKFCKVLVEPSSIFPMANYISSGSCQERGGEKVMNFAAKYDKVEHLVSAKTEGEVITNRGVASAPMLPVSYMPMTEPISLPKYSNYQHSSRPAGGVTYPFQDGSRVEKGRWFKTIPEENKEEETYSDTNDNDTNCTTNQKPEDLGAGEAVSKPNTGAVVEFGGSNQSNNTFYISLLISNMPPKPTYQFLNIASQPTTSNAQLSNFPPLDFILFHSDHKVEKGRWFKTIPEENKEETYSDTNDNDTNCTTNQKPEDLGAGETVSKPNTGAVVEFGGSNQSNNTFYISLLISNIPPKPTYQFLNISSQPTTLNAQLSNFPPLLNSNPIVNHQSFVQAARMTNVISLTNFTEKQSMVDIVYPTGSISIDERSSESRISVRRKCFAMVFKILTTIICIVNIPNILFTIGRRSNDPAKLIHMPKGGNRTGAKPINYPNTRSNQEVNTNSLLETEDQVEVTTEE